jgi:hypothetical protein
MNVQSIIYANDHIESLIADAAKRRSIATLPRTTLRQRLVAIASNVRAAFADPTTTPGSVIPAVH